MFHSKSKILPTVAGALTASMLLSSCAQYASVTERRPLLHPLRTTAGVLVATERQLSSIIGRGKGAPQKALGYYLDAAAAATRDIQRNPNDQKAREAYNYAVARIFTAIRDGHLNPWDSPLKVSSESGDYVLTHRADPLKRKAWNPALYDFTPSDQFDVKGTYVHERTVKAGLGAPLVAVGRQKRDDAAAMFVADQTFYGVTAWVRFDGRKATLALEDPLAKETVDLGGHTYPLAADFTVPLAVMLAKEDPKKLEISRALNPEKYAYTAHIVRLQPYDPNKTVVLVVHGLVDTPATWTPMLNSLRGDPAIRDNYQFWYYSYPSGYPYPYSAAIMRHQLDAVEKAFPLKKPMVLIGHSMGGIISRLMITDSGDKLWMTAFGKPPAETKLSPEARTKLEDALIFKHRPEVGRVIFISAPHRGSNMATNWLGRLGSSLVKAPVSLAKIGNEMRAAMVADPTVLKLNRLPNSVDTLAPNNRFVKAVGTIPLTPGIPYHSIMGDRGRGDTPNSSDGVVPYWSSHLDGARSELIVPSNHSAHQNPKAIAEVRRILRLNAGLSTPTTKTANQ